MAGRQARAEHGRSRQGGSQEASGGPGEGGTRALERKMEEAAARRALAISVCVPRWELALLVHGSHVQHCENMQHARALLSMGAV